MMQLSNSPLPLSRTISAPEALLETIGLSALDLIRLSTCETLALCVSPRATPQLTLALEHRLLVSVQLWAKFCRRMARDYVREFAEGPIILISNPSPAMCLKHGIPDNRAFLCKTLGRIIEAIGPDHVVDVVDCLNDPLCDPFLAQQADRWVTSFSTLISAMTAQCDPQVHP